MDDQEKSERLNDYISAMTAYYTNVLIDEKDIVKRPYVEGKLNMIKDFRKKLNELK